MPHSPCLTNRSWDHCFYFPNHHYRHHASSPSLWTPCAMKSVYRRMKHFYYTKTHGRDILPPSISEGLDGFISGVLPTKQSKIQPSGRKRFVRYRVASLGLERSSSRGVWGNVAQGLHRGFAHREERDWAGWLSDSGIQEATWCLLFKKGHQAEDVTHSSSKETFTVWLLRPVDWLIIVTPFK